MKEIWSNMEQSHSDVARSSGKIWKDHEQIERSVLHKLSERSVEPLRRIWIAARRFCRFGRTQPSCPRRLGKYSAFCTGQGGGSFVLHPGDSWMFHGCFMDVSWMFHGCFMMLHNVSCFLGVLQVAVSKFGRSCHVLSGPEAGVRLPMTPTPARAGARFSPYEPKESQETSGDFGRLQETSGDFGFIL